MHDPLKYDEDKASKIIEGQDVFRSANLDNECELFVLKIDSNNYDDIM